MNPAAQDGTHEARRANAMRRSLVSVVFGAILAVVNPEGKVIEEGVEALQEMKLAKAVKTGHALDRQAEGRSTRQAFGDAQQARQADVFRQGDDRYVVRGPKSREHVLAREARRHITTINGRSRADHLGRLRNNTIQPVTEDEYEEFKRVYK